VVCSLEGLNIELSAKKQLWKKLTNTAESNEHVSRAARALVFVNRKFTRIGCAGLQSRKAAVVSRKHAFPPFGLAGPYDGCPSMHGNK
jgi:hypothetical protein